MACVEEGQAFGKGIGSPLTCVCDHFRRHACCRVSNTQPRRSTERRRVSTSDAGALMMLHVPSSCGEGGEQLVAEVDEEILFGREIGCALKQSQQLLLLLLRLSRSSARPLLICFLLLGHQLWRMLAREGEDGLQRENLKIDSVCLHDVPQPIVLLRPLDLLHSLCSSPTSSHHGGRKKLPPRLD